jgi:hypothetical protein
MTVGHCLSGGALNSKSQGKWNSLPNTRLVGVNPIVSWVEAL